MSGKHCFILLKPSPIVLPQIFGLNRKPPRRMEDMQDDYLEKFDFNTLYYDIFEVDGMVLGIGPPMRNLRDYVEGSEVRIDGADASLDVLDLDRTQITKFKSGAASGKVMSFEHELGSISCEIGRDLTDIFRGRNVLITKSKNNEISWILEWAKFYVANHQVSGIVIYDNGSTQYRPEDVLESLRGVEGLQACAVVDWNYPWGSPGGVWAGNRTIPWDSDYCQYGAMEHARYRLLSSASLVINHDIDELLVSENGRAAGDILAEMGVAGIEYNGRWIEAVRTQIDDKPKFSHYRFYDKNRPACTKKWVINPRLSEDARQWKLHSVEGLQLSNTNDLSHRHFMAINNNWKHNRTKSKLYDKAKHVEDKTLMAAMEKSCAQLRPVGLGHSKTSASGHHSMIENGQDHKMMPHMPEAAISALTERLESSKCYLEYGSGGSTVLAAGLGVRRIISVDTDAEWFQKVKSEVGPGYAGDLEMLYVDIGPTKKWGYPVSNSRFQHWSNYYMQPWKYIRASGLTPDLILIDGRFRVSCFLASLVHSAIGTTILFDDYTNRAHYHAVEDIIKPVNKHDRMVEFVKSFELSSEDVFSFAAQFFMDSR